MRTQKISSNGYPMVFVCFSDYLFRQQPAQNVREGAQYSLWMKSGKRATSVFHHSVKTNCCLFVHLSMLLLGNHLWITSRLEWCGIKLCSGRWIFLALRVSFRTSYRTNIKLCDRIFNSIHLQPFFHFKKASTKHQSQQKIPMAWKIKQYWQT